MVPLPPLRQRPFQLAFFSVAALTFFALFTHQEKPAFAQNNKAQNASPQRMNKPGDAAAVVARGKYIVEGVAMCGQCHTPHDSNGNPDPRRILQGSPVPYMSPTHDPNWPISAPRIGGTPPADDEAMVKLLTTGIWTTGERLRYPMPQFRMERSDAEAVVAYLKSLTPQEE